MQDSQSKPFPRPGNFLGATRWRSSDIEKLIGEKIEREAALLTVRDVARITGFGISTVFLPLIRFSKWQICPASRRSPVCESAPAANGRSDCPRRSMAKSWLTAGMGRPHLDKAELPVGCCAASEVRVEPNGCCKKHEGLLRWKQSIRSSLRMNSYAVSHMKEMRRGQIVTSAPIAYFIAPTSR